MWSPGTAYGMSVAMYYVGVPTFTYKEQSGAALAKQDCTASSSLSPK